MATEKSRRAERLNRTRRAQKEKPEEVQGKQNQENGSAYVNLTVRRDEYHRIPYFI